MCITTTTEIFSVVVPFQRDRTNYASLTAVVIILELLFYGCNQEFFMVH